MPAAVRGDIIVFFEQFRHVAKRRQRGAKLVRDGRHKIGLQPCHRELALHDTPDEVAAADEEQKDHCKCRRQQPSSTRKFAGRRRYISWTEDECPWQSGVGNRCRHRC
jgi:hypothetical protein